MSNKDTINIQRLADLACLQIKDNETAHYQHSFESVLTFIDKIKQTDVTNVEPMANPLNASQRLRPDVVSETNCQVAISADTPEAIQAVTTREAMQAIAPNVQDGYYLVPQVIKGK